MIATGIKNVPIRIVAPNREVELAEFFKDKNYLGEENIKTLQNISYLKSCGNPYKAYGH